MQKITFKCDDCEVEGTIRLGNSFDEYVVQCCPCCGTPLLLEDDDTDEDE